MKMMEVVVVVIDHSESYNSKQSWMQLTFEMLGRVVVVS